MEYNETAQQLFIDYFKKFYDTFRREVLYNIVTWWSDYGRVLEWWSDLLDSLIQGVTTLYSSLLHTHTHTHTTVHSNVFTAVAW
jgi:hypothetical protein